jgi:hypothetical protein
VCEGERDERVRNAARCGRAKGVGAEGGPDCAPMEIVEAPLEPAKAAKRGLQRGWARDAGGLAAGRAPPLGARPRGVPGAPTATSAAAC